MQQKITLKLAPSEVSDDKKIKILLAQGCAVKENAVTGYTLVKKSLDARGRQTWFSLTFTTMPLFA